MTNLENGMIVKSEVFHKPNYFGICEHCGHVIHAADDTHYGEYYIEIGREMYVHEDCMFDWIQENRREAV